MELRFGDPAEAAEAIAELDELGYAAVWVPGGIGGDITGDLDRLLAATKRTTLATGIINIWKHEPQEIASWWKALPADKQQRLLLGLGISHSALIGEAYSRPVAVMRDYLDRLEKEGLDLNATCLAALAPKMLELSRDRTAGSHPYLVTPEHTAWARKILGPGKLLLPEQGVVLEKDPVKARELARQAVTHYTQLTNYVNNWKRLGFSDDEIMGVSDRLIDEVFAWGDVDQIAKRVNAHLAAGADHVCLQVVTGANMDIAAARPAWRELAAALL
jgi:probable F420-dependent oxidoreductase